MEFIKYTISITFISIFTLLIILSSIAHLQNRPTIEELKAVFVYNFLKFAEWPEEKENKHLNLCIIGKTPISEYIKSLNKKRIQDKEIKVFEIKETEIKNILQCQAIFLGEISEQNKKKILSKLKNKAILSISDQKEFVKQGGIIELLQEGNKLRFKVNFSLAQKSNLKISSRLLRLAKEVL